MITIVCAASSNHFKSSLQFFKSVPANMNKVFYDIGLNESESNEFKKTFPDISYEIFDFTKYPDFVNLKESDAGAYAWKPIIVSEVYKKYNHHILLWSDAGNIITRDISNLFGLIEQNKIYSSATSGLIRHWTHPSCLQNMYVDPHLCNYQMRNAAFIGFLGQDPLVLNFIEEWKTNALIKNNSLPDGANRTNHRHDQSILSILYYRYNIPIENRYIGFTSHNDID